MIEIETNLRIYEIEKGVQGNYYQRRITMIMIEYGGATREFFDLVGLEGNPKRGWRKKLGSAWKKGRRLDDPVLPKKKKTKSRSADKKFYASWEWKKLRFEILKKYGAVCMLCGSKEYIVCDHIKPRKKFPELELEQDNIQVLCNSCNMGKSNDDYTDFRPVSFGH